MFMPQQKIQVTNMRISWSVILQMVYGVFANFMLSYEPKRLVNL